MNLGTVAELDGDKVARGAGPGKEGGGVSAGCWVLGAGCWVLGAGCWVLGAGCEVRGARCEVRGCGEKYRALRQRGGRLRSPRLAPPLVPGEVACPDPGDSEMSV
ncbi:MAG TPA: hypothetical protein VFJ16_20670 [Longimicrobium sp.]|nr:hypothetical protein [Longimicrobium sp.]